MRENLTEAFRQVLAGAEREARGLNQEFVGTDHLFLGVLDNADCEAARVLRQAGIDVEAAKTILLRSLVHGQHTPVVTGALPLSPRAHSLLSACLVKAQALRESRVTTRLLMLSLLEEPQTVVQETLRRSGGDIDQLTQSLAQAIGQAER